jgi:hypothetical protein
LVAAGAGPKQPVSRAEAAPSAVALAVGCGGVEDRTSAESQAWVTRAARRRVGRPGKRRIPVMVSGQGTTVKGSEELATPPVTSSRARSSSE